MQKGRNLGGTLHTMEQVLTGRIETIVVPISRTGGKSSVDAAEKVKWTSDND